MLCEIIAQNEQQLCHKSLCGFHGQRSEKQKNNKKHNKNVSDIMAKIMFTCYNAYFVFQLLLVIVCSD